MDRLLTNPRRRSVAANVTGGYGMDGEGQRNAKGQFVKGSTKPANAGRGPTPSTFTVKQEVLKAFRMAGGAEYLLKLTKGTNAERAAFVNLCSKLIPTEITGELKHALEVIVVEREGARPVIEHAAEPAITYDPRQLPIGLEKE